jgi:hypothetical protein
MSQTSQGKGHGHEKADPKKVAHGQRPTDPELQNEGEGSRTAARRYDKGAEAVAKHPDEVKKAAEAARKALEGKEGDELREAEARGKSGVHPHTPK